LVTKVLKIPQFPEDDGMSEMKVGAGRIDAEFHPQWAVGAEFFRQLRFADNLRGAAGESCKLIAHIHAH
jgi:hypothetical protein